MKSPSRTVSPHSRPPATIRNKQIFNKLGCNQRDSDEVYVVDVPSTGEMSRTHLTWTESNPVCELVSFSDDPIIKQPFYDDPLCEALFREELFFDELFIK